MVTGGRLGRVDVNRRMNSVGGRGEYERRWQAGCSPMGAYDMANKSALEHSDSMM